MTNNEILTLMASDLIRIFSLAELDKDSDYYDVCDTYAEQCDTYYERFWSFVELLKLSIHANNIEKRFQ